MVKTGVKLMVVDDVSTIREFIQRYFERRGFTIFTAGSAEDALPIIREQAPHIIILDVNLPKMSGIDMLKVVRQFNERVKVILVTGSDIEYQKDPEFLKLNVFDVMRKPVTIEALSLNIEKLLNLN